jgi:hypothetical protein
MTTSKPAYKDTWINTGRKLVLIKDLIRKLQDLYDQEMQHVDVMGEPEICIDVFEETGHGGRQYAGVHTGDFVFDRTADGVYNVISAFAESYPKESK